MGPALGHCSVWNMSVRACALPNDLVMAAAGLIGPGWAALRP